MKRLGVRSPTLAPRATEHIPEMIELIQELIAKGIAYDVSGNVYFDVARFPSYGKLSGRNLDEMIEGGGGRVEKDENKKNPLDFALWKSAKEGEPSWESPWGNGRPGWHIECSAMAIKHLGKTIDLHGGGNDLIFPHHENEIAQSTAYTGQEFVRYFIHHGHVMVNHEKMSKSLGNFFTIQDIFEKSHFPEPITAEVVRFYLLSTHYRSPIDFSDTALAEAKAGLNHFYTLFQKLEESASSSGMNDIAGSVEKFEAAMDDDFNTVEAIAVLQQLRREANINMSNAKAARTLFASLGKVLGLFNVPVKEWEYRAWESSGSLLTADKKGIQLRIDARNSARQKGNFAMADKIRKELSELGYMLEDRPDGTTRVKK
jgi:cysteinyl-tRNA synthetase